MFSYHVHDFILFKISYFQEAGIIRTIDALSMRVSPAELSSTINPTYQSYKPIKIVNNVAISQGSF